MPRNPRKHIHRISLFEQGSPEVGEVTDKDSRIKVSCGKMFSGIFEQGVLKANKTYSLVDETKFLNLDVVDYVWVRVQSFSVLFG